MSCRVCQKSKKCQEGPRGCRGPEGEIGPTGNTGPTGPVIDNCCDVTYLDSRSSVKGNIVEIVPTTTTIIDPVGVIKPSCIPDWLWVQQAGSDSPFADVGFAIATDCNGNSYISGLFRGTVEFGDTTLVSALNQRNICSKDRL